MADSTIERSKNVTVVRDSESGVFVAVDVNGNGTKLDSQDVSLVWKNDGNQVIQRGQGECVKKFLFDDRSPQNMSPAQLGDIAVDLANRFCPTPKRSR